MNSPSVVSSRRSSVQERLAVGSPEATFLRETESSPGGSTSEIAVIGERRLRRYWVESSGSEVPPVAGSSPSSEGPQSPTVASQVSGTPAATRGPITVIEVESDESDEEVQEVPPPASQPEEEAKREHGVGEDSGVDTDAELQEEWALEAARVASRPGQPPQPMLPLIFRRGSEPPEGSSAYETEVRRLLTSSGSRTRRSHRFLRAGLTSEWRPR